MKLDFLFKLNTVKKADPDAVRKKQIRSRNLNISIKSVAAVFSVIVVLLGIVSAAVVISEKHKDAVPASLSGDVTSTLGAQEILGSDQVNISGNYLFALTEEDNSNLKLISLINLSSETKKLKMTVVPVGAVSTVNNVEATMAEHLESGGITQLLWAVGEFSKVSIEKYMYCDESGFVEIMKTLGNTEINIPSQVNHQYNGINFIIDEGVQVITPDMMLKYFLYVCENVFTEPENLTAVFSVVANKLLSVEDYTEIEKNYGKIVNHINTNISPLDVSAFIPDIISITQEGGFNNIEITPDIEHFR